MCKSIKKWGVLLIFLLTWTCFSGCKVEEGDTKKISDLSFIVVKDEEIPERLRQASSGYSIQVKECYLTSNAIVFKTNLLGPSKSENIVETKTYPYIVVKTEYREEMVVFQ